MTKLTKEEYRNRHISLQNLDIFKLRFQHLWTFVKIGEKYNITSNAVQSAYKRTRKQIAKIEILYSCLFGGFDVPVKTLLLSRLTNCLLNDRYETLQQVHRQYIADVNQLLSIPNFGSECMEELETLFAIANLPVRGSHDL